MHYLIHKDANLGVEGQHLQKSCKKVIEKVLKKSMNVRINS